MIIWINLKPAEQLHAATVGCRRHIRAMMKGRRDRGAVEDRTKVWGSDIEGASAEMALAKHLKIYWDCDRDLDHEGDVGDLHVRSTTHHTGKLLIYDHDPDATFVLMITDLPRVGLAGCINSKIARGHDEWYDDKNFLVPCWAVPQSALEELGG